jgi:hypothetical protein
MMSYLPPETKCLSLLPTFFSFHLLSFLTLSPLRLQSVKSNDHDSDNGILVILRMESKKVGCDEEAYKFEMKDEGAERRPIASLTNRAIVVAQ